MPNRDSELNAFEEQIKAIKDSSSLLTIVCGTGVSMASVNEKLKEKISWLGLIQQGLEFAQALGLNVTEELNQIQTPEQKKAINADLLIELAGKVQKHLQEQDQYENWLASNVGDAVLPDPNKMILINALADCAKISHVNLATTNYDYLLSRAQGWNPTKSDHLNTPISWQDRSGLASWMLDKSNRVLHLHGDAYNAESVIFSQADYDRLNKDGEDGWTSRIRSAISTTHVVLFIGCGNTTNDPAFKRILKLYEATLVANRFNTKWFQLAKSDEHRFPRGIKKLTYGDNYDDLPIFVKDTLLPLLKTHLAKTENGKNETTEIVENNQKPLQVLTQIRQTENLTDIGNNQNSPTAIVMQQPPSPIPSDFQNDETDLLKKLINKKFSDLSSDNQKILIKGLIVKTDESLLNENNWFGLNCFKRISIIKLFWEELNKLNNNDINFKFKEILILLTFQACVKIINIDELNDVLKIADFIKKETSVEKRDLSVATLVHSKHGYGCEIEIRDDTWGVKNQLFTSRLQPIEADGLGAEYFTSVKNEINGIINLKNASDNQNQNQIISDINTYKEINLAQLYLVDDDRKLTIKSKEQLVSLGIQILEISEDTDENLFNFLKEISKNYSNLTNMKRKEKEDGLNKGTNINIINSTITNSQIGDGNINITTEIEKLPENENKSWLNIFKFFFRGKNVKNNSK